MDNIAKIKIHEIMSQKDITDTDGRLNLDNYFFLSEDLKLKIREGLEKIKELEGDSPAGLFEEYHIMVKRKLDIIQQCINKMPNCTLGELAERSACGDVYMYVEDELNNINMFASENLITWEIPSHYESGVEENIEKAIVKRKRMFYLSIAIVCILSFLFFFMAKSELQNTSKWIFGIIVLAVFAMQNALSCFINGISR